MLKVRLHHAPGRELRACGSLAAASKPRGRGAEGPLSALRRPDLGLPSASPQSFALSAGPGMRLAKLGEQTWSLEQGCQATRKTPQRHPPRAAKCGRMGRELSTAPWSYMRWENHDTGSVTASRDQKPSPVPAQESCKEKEEISIGSLGPAAQPHTLTWEWGWSCGAQVKQGRGADAKQDEAASTLASQQCRATKTGQRWTRSWAA